MKITCLGCGNAFTKKSFNQTFLLEEGDKRMLIDNGRTTPEALEAAEINVKSITDVYISHLHGDHIGGLEDMAFKRYDWVKRPRSYKEENYAPRLIGDERLLQDLWDRSLRGGLESMEGFVATLETFFEPVPVKPNKPIVWEGWTMELIQQIHIMSGSMIMWTFGVMFSKTGHKTIYFTTDSQHCSPKQMEEFYRKSDIIFQDCECSGVNFKFQEGERVYEKDGKWDKWPEDAMKATELLAMGVVPQEWKAFKFSSGVHANYAQLAGYDSANSVKLSSEIKEKMYLSHYQDFVLDKRDMFGNETEWEDTAKKDGFKGFIRLGDSLDI